ncbi:flagellar motor stator protein MotA [Pontivivens insulae]|uniref:Motility protein A n=1 Tax=Pontivivens insulae TaxID=1639689 RepID=A0A2R8AAF4_9RHOB|nr:flagellar motor stator protein MotA [Pontivivens insulae]RED12947.1 chemotaxis protein MotA [Pontivivens insulae]SPF29040.1 Motility protein A [Pontivivens insulae]
MTGVIGIVVVLVMVFGGYLWSGGKFGVILGSLHYELMIIGGSAVGAFIIANSSQLIKQTLSDLGRVFRGSRWREEDYADLLILLFALLRVAKKNPAELEEHIEQPQESSIFNAYPRLLADGELVEIICDTLRAQTLNYDDPHQVEEVLEKRLEARLHHSLESAHALQVMADGLPALGIVAAVLGVIKTMSSIDQPPEVLGKMIGGALVGTFLGVFLSYAFVGPFAAKVRAVKEQENSLYLLVKEVLVAALHGHAPNICVEIGRQNTPRDLRPLFDELDEALRNAPGKAA